MDIKISTQNYDIINTGCAIVQMGEYIEFEINNLKFRIVFIEEDGAQNNGHIATRIEQAETQNAYLGIYIYNQKNAFFSSIPNLLNVATIENKTLFLKFSIQSINEREGNSDKILFYSWYLNKMENSQNIIPNNMPQSDL